MNPRSAVYVFCLFAVSGSLALYAATGFMAFTRFADRGADEAVAADGPVSLEDLFSETGLNDEAGELGEIDNRFALGLLPAGPGRASLSVLSVAAVCLVLSAGAWWIGRRAEQRACGDAHDTTDTGAQGDGATRDG